MTPGQLVNAIAIAMDVPVETVVQHDRNLAVAGLRTSGARGRNAPDVTPMDAARLMIAILASVRTMDSVATVKEFGRAVLSRPVESADPEESADIAIRSLPKGHNFIEGLAAVIAAASEPIDDLPGHLKRFGDGVVLCQSEGNGLIGGRGCSASYDVPRERPRTKLSPQEWVEARYWQHGISQSRFTPGTAIMLLGAAFRDNGLKYASPREAYLAGYGTKTNRTALARALSQLFAPRKGWRDEEPGT